MPQTPTNPSPFAYKEYPASSSQKRLFIFEKLYPNTTVYHIPLALQIMGFIDYKLLEESLRQLIQRHEILRTAFTEHDGQIYQRIIETYQVTLPFYDLSSQPTDKRHTQALVDMQQTNQETFDLEKAPLFRTKLYCLDDDSYIFFVCLHHIIFDGWSTGVFFRELSEIYMALQSGMMPKLEPLPIQHVDYTIWQLDEADFETGLQFWEKNLAGASYFAQLPTDYLRPTTPNLGGQTLRFELSVELTQDIKIFSQKKSQTTLFTVLYTAFISLLYHFSQQDDLIIGVPVANRNMQELTDQIGYFANTLPLRSQLSPKLSFRQLLNQTAHNLYQSMDYQDVPFESIVNRLNPERNLNYNPLFQVMFSLQDATTNLLHFANIPVEKINIHNHTARCDLFFAFEETQDTLKGGIEYNTNLFKKSTIEQLLSCYINLIEDAIENPDMLLESLTLLNRAETQKILNNFNNTMQDYPQNILLSQLFEQQVARIPAGIAIKTINASLSYAELDNRANRIASYLQSKGCSVGSPIALYMERSPEMVIAILGILKAGCAYVPLSTKYPPARIQFILDDIQLDFVLTTPNLTHQLPAHIEPINVEDLLTTTIENQPQPKQDATSHDLAYIIYTSGSTGTPKGVRVSHHNICNLVLDEIERFTLTCDSRSLHVPAISFDVATGDLFMTLCSGATLCLAPPDVLLIGENLQQWLKYFEATHLSITPTALATLPKNEFKNLQTLIVAGEACPADLVNTWADGRQFFNAYGPTEATVYATVQKCQPQKYNPLIGRPIANTQIYILRDMKPIPPAFVGELYIGGRGVAQGYHRREALTAERFIESPFSKDPTDKLYKTGDLAKYTADGTIMFLGRADYQIKLNGYRIELQEIEHIIREYHGIKQAVVTIQQMKNKLQQIVAYVAATTLDLNQLRQFLHQQLPSYMLPSLIIPVSEFPLNSSGKIDRSALPRIEDVPTEGDDLLQKLSYIEQILLEIWQDILEIKAIRLDDDFFNKGGHSLMALKIISAIENHLGVNLPLDAVFKYSTIQSLSRVVEDKLLQQIRNLPEAEIQSLLNEIQQHQGS